MLATDVLFDPLVPDPVFLGKLLLFVGVLALLGACLMYASFRRPYDSVGGHEPPAPAPDAGPEAAAVERKDEELLPRIGSGLEPAARVYSLRPRGPAGSDSAVARSGETVQ